MKQCFRKQIETSSNYNKRKSIIMLRSRGTASLNEIWRAAKWIAKEWLGNGIEEKRRELPASGTLENHQAWRRMKPLLFARSLGVFVWVWLGQARLVTSYYNLDRMSRLRGTQHTLNNTYTSHSHGNSDSISRRRERDAAGWHDYFVPAVKPSHPTRVFFFSCFISMPTHWHCYHFSP